MSISLYDPVATELAQLQATDKDSNDNGELSYYLLRHGEIVDYLTVNERRGHIHLSRRLDKRLLGLNKVLVEVVDHGLKPHRTQAVLDVNVTDTPRTFVAAEQSSKLGLPHEKALLIILALIIMVLLVTVILVGIVILFRKRRRGRNNR